MFKLFAGHNDEFLKMDSLSLPERMPANGASCLNRAPRSEGSSSCWRNCSHGLPNRLIHCTRIRWSGCRAMFSFNMGEQLRILINLADTGFY